MPVRRDAAAYQHITVSNPSVNKAFRKPATSDPTQLSPITRSSEWVSHFADNEARQRPISWELGAAVSDEELFAISDSLRAWQLGETSDGSHLMEAARHYAASIGDPEFVAAVRLFIAEEQRHGANLGRFLDLAGVPRARSNWGDSLFRAIRYAVPRMETWVTPVVMVETHALIYYNAMRRATRSPVLRAICGQILADEVTHIRFQCERIAILHRTRPAWLRLLTINFQKLMFAGVTLAIWAGHRKALRAGGYDLALFWRAAWRKMNRAWRAMSPERYHFAGPPLERRPDCAVLKIPRPSPASLALGTSHLALKVSPMPRAVIHGIYTSPGHNYFGHHDQAPDEHEIVEHEAAELIAGKGIPGDRFFEWKDDYKGQLTLIDRGVIDDIRQHSENPDLPASAFRRNVVISGIDLNRLVGRVFRLGDALLEGTQKCAPCYWMDQACGKAGTEKVMHNRGGLRCRILESGTIRTGEVEFSS